VGEAEEEEEEERDVDQEMADLYHIPPAMMEDEGTVERLRELGALPPPLFAKSMGQTELPLKPLEGRGDLVAEQRHDKLQQELTRLRREAFIEGLFALSALWLLLTVVLNVWAFLPAFFSMLVLAAFALAFGHGWGRGVPAIVHENGVEVVTPTGRRRFIPWGHFTRVGTPLHRLYFSKVSHEERLVFTLPPTREQPEGLVIRAGWRSAVLFEPDFPHLEEVWGVVVERLGERECFTVGYKGEAERSFLRLQVAAILFMAGLGLLRGWAWAYDGELTPGDGTLYKTFLWGSVLSVFGIVIALVVIPAKYAWDDVKLMPKLRIYTGAVVAMLVVFAVTGVVGWNEAWSPSGTVVPSEDPGESQLAVGHYEGQGLVAWGPVVVHDGEELVLLNCTLTFSPDPWGKYGIWVGPGGYLEMVNTTVRSSKFRVGWTFEVHGKAFLGNCWFKDLATGSWDHEVDGGLEVHGGELIVANTWFEGVDGPALVLSGAEAKVSLCRIWDCTGPAIIAHDSILNVTDCDMSSAMQGIQFVRSEGRVEGTVFEHMDRGVVSKGSSVALVDCRFVWISKEAVLYRGGAPEMTRCDGVEEEGAIVEIGASRDFTSTSEYCTLILMVVALVVAYNAIRGMGRWVGGEWKPRLNEAAVEELKAELALEFGGVEVKCPACQTINVVTTEKRPHEFRCGECNALLRLRQ
jgi:hypothetical protein